MRIRIVFVSAKGEKSRLVIRGRAALMAWRAVQRYAEEI